MEILFIRIKNRIAGIATTHLEEVLHTPFTFPALPVSPHIKEMMICHGSAVGIVDLQDLFEIKQDTRKREVIILKCDGVTFGLKVNKILQVKNVSQSRLIPPQKNSFLPVEFLECACKVKKTAIPVISPSKILQHPEIKPLWYGEKFENTGIAFS